MFTADYIGYRIFFATSAGLFQTDPRRRFLLWTPSFGAYWP